MKINIRKCQEGVKVPEFQLPEINIYPQNRFGDIARSQGLSTARNWRKVKEGTTKGINDFANSDHAQFVKAVLPLPETLNIAGNISKGLGLLKQRYARNMYNNIMPMSYFASYTKKGKPSEFFNGVKDFITGKDLKDLNNPKWKEATKEIFKQDKNLGIDPEMATEARMEVFQNYLRLPHKNKYFIPKEDGLFEINLSLIPKSNKQKFIDNIENGKSILDYLVGTGGWVNASKTPLGNNLFKFNYSDVWDIQPFKVASRSPLARIKVNGKRIFTNKIPNPNNPYGADIEYKKWIFPNLWKDIEVGKFMGGKPFKVVSSGKFSTIDGVNTPMFKKGGFIK